MTSAAVADPTNFFDSVTIQAAVDGEPDAADLKRMATPTGLVLKQEARADAADNAAASESSRKRQRPTTTVSVSEPETETSVPESEAPPPPPVETQYKGLLVTWFDHKGNAITEPVDCKRIHIERRSFKGKTGPTNELALTYTNQRGSRVPLIFKTPELVVTFYGYERRFQDNPESQPRTSVMLSLGFPDHFAFVSAMERLDDNSEATLESLDEFERFWRDLRAMEMYINRVIWENRKTLLGGIAVPTAAYCKSLQITENDVWNHPAARQQIWHQLFTDDTTSTKDGKQYPPGLKLEVPKLRDTLQCTIFDQRRKPVPWGPETLQSHHKIIALVHFERYSFFQRKLNPKLMLTQAMIVADPDPNFGRGPTAFGFA